METKRVIPLFIWSGGILLGLILKVVYFPSPSVVDLFKVGHYLLSLFAPFFVIVGVYFSRSLTQGETDRQVTLLACIGALGAGLASWGGQEFVPDLSGFGLFRLHSLFLLFSILAGAAFVGIIASPCFLVGKIAIWKKRVVFLILATFLVATLPHSWNIRNQFSNLAWSPEEAWSFIHTSDLVLPVYTLNEETYYRLALAAGFPKEGTDLDQFILPPPISVQEANQISAGYLIVFEDEPINVDPAWWRMGSFGRLGTPRAVVYRILSPQEAQVAFEEANIKSLANPDRGALFDLYAASVSVSEFCEAYRAWVSSNTENTSRLSSVPLSAKKDCFELGDNLVRIEDLDRDGTFLGFSISEPETALDSYTLSLRQITLPVFDMRTVFADVILEPNTLYLYSVEVKSSSPVATLFWRTGMQENYFELRSYPDWTRVSLLLLTPNKESGDQNIYIAPALFDHLDDVNLRDLFFGKVDFFD